VGEELNPTQIDLIGRLGPRFGTAMDIDGYLVIESQSCERSLQITSELVSATTMAMPVPPQLRPACSSPLLTLF